MKKVTVETINYMSVSYDMNYEAMLKRASTGVLKAALRKETRKNAQRKIKSELRRRGVVRL